MISTNANTVEEYIASFSPDIQKKLADIRKTVNKAAPGASEAIKYQMPTLVFHGNMLSYGVFKSHIGMYPAPSGSEAFNKELEPYRSGKASIQFPLDKPMPLKLINHVVELLVGNQIVKAELKKLKKKKT